MEVNNEMRDEIKKLQLLEQNLQTLLIQKQAFQAEVDDTENALNEILKAQDEVFKIVGNIMVRAEKEELEKELKRKHELLSLRLKSIERQEEELNKEIEKIRKKVLESLK